MPQFEMLCLANSRKYGARCVAGLLYGGGGWIRPIGTTEMGALTPTECSYQDGTEPRVLDRISLELLEPCPEWHQPENWRITSGRWQRLASPERSVRLRHFQKRLVVGPELLGSRDDRISCDTFSAQYPAAASLALILPEQIRWSVRLTSNRSCQVRTHFLLGDTHYNLAVTDPVWEKQCGKLEELEKRYTTEEVGFMLRPDERLLLTVSLGQPFNGYRYKLAAAVFAIPI